MTGGGGVLTREKCPQIFEGTDLSSNGHKIVIKYTLDTMLLGISSESERVNRGPLLVHNGVRAAKTLKKIPQVGTNFLGSGWTPEKVLALKAAIEELVFHNPILTGIVLFKNDAVFIEPGHHRQSLWTELVPDGPIDKFSTGWQHGPAMAKIEFIKKHLAPLLPKLKTVEEEAKASSPVFQVYLMTLPEEHLFYSVRMSHAVGDASTYYQILNQISHLLIKGANDLPHINWEAPAHKGSKEFFQDHLSPRDVSRAYGIPFVLGILPRAIMGTKRYSYIMLSRSKINQKKDELKSPDEEYLTTNDIILAALCQANRRQTILAQIVNCRGKADGLEEQDGGNFLQEILLPRKAALDPNQVRKITRAQKYFEANQVPFRPMVAGRLGRVSNWSSVKKSLEFEGTRVVAEVPPTGFVEALPFDTAIIFSMDDDHMGLLHNYKTIDTTSGLLKEIMA